MRVAARSGTVPMDEALSNEISKIRKALIDIRQLISTSAPEQREKLEEIRLILEVALEAAPRRRTNDLSHR